MALLTKRREPIQVASRHIPYVEPLWTRLTAAQKAVADKEEYVRTAGQLGVRLMAVTTLADGTETDAKAVRKAAADLQRIKRLLAVGAEPTTPPDWYCGHLTEPPKTTDRWGEERYPAETWPSRNWSGRGTALVFNSAIPLDALQRYAAAKPLIDDARIYSPRDEDFYRLPEPQPRDPVLIGMVRFLGEPQYFEIARWDIDRDLATLFTAVERQR